MKTTLIQRICAVMVTGTILFAHAKATDAVIHVDASATGTNDGTSWADAYTDLQSALAAAVAGDEIWVAAGTYKPGGPIELGGRGKAFFDAFQQKRMASFHLISGIALYGGFTGTEIEREARDPAANPTILSGDLNGDDVSVASTVALSGEVTRLDNSFHVVTADGADDTTVLDGFVITGGYANGTGSESNGGGMINRATTAGHPTLINCTFDGNFAFFSGGGIHNFGGDLTLIACTFRQNYAHSGGNNSGVGQGGGGMFSSNANALLFDCIFSQNASRTAGGGMHSGASPMLIGCQFVNNQIFFTGGGGLYLFRASRPLILNCAFFGNRAPIGAGMGVHRCEAPTFVNSVFSGNTASAMGLTGPATLINCTISGNSNSGGGGAGITIPLEGDLDLQNCVIWGNASSGRVNRAAQISGSTVNMSHSCVQGSLNEEMGNIAFDPLFRDLDGPDDILGTVDDDLRLMDDSPCIDAGDDDALPADVVDLDFDSDATEPIPLDLDGNIRVYGDGIDMGAYEVTSAEAAVNPVPTNRAMDVSRNVILSWEPGVFAQTHDVYFGTARDAVRNASVMNPLGVLVSQGQIETTFDPGSLDFRQTYYWRVDEVNGGPDYRVFEGRVWSFMTEQFSYPITNISATASGSFGSQSIPENTVNGSGLTDGLHSSELTDM